MSQNLQDATGLTAALASGALATATVTSGVKTTVAVPFAIGGKLYSKAITDNIALACEPGSGVAQTPDAFTTLPAGKTCTFALLLDSAGAVTAAQGDFVDNGSVAPISTSFPSNKAIFGALKVVNTTNPFVPATTLLGAAGVTATYVNLAQHPGVSI